MTYGVTPSTPLSQLVEYLGSRLVAAWIPGHDPIGAIGGDGRGPRVEVNDGMIIDFGGHKAVTVDQGTTPPRLIPSITIPDTDASFMVIGQMGSGLASATGAIFGNNDSTGSNVAYSLKRDWNNDVLVWADLTWAWTRDNIAANDRWPMIIPAHSGASFGVACDRSGSWCGLRLNYHDVISRSDASATYNFRDTYIGGDGPNAGSGCTISFFAIVTGAVTNDPTFLELWDKVQHDFLVHGYGSTPVLI